MTKAEIERLKDRLTPKARQMCQDVIGREFSVRMDKNTVVRGKIKHAGIGGWNVTARGVGTVFAVDIEGPNGQVTRVHVTGLPRF